MPFFIAKRLFFGKKESQLESSPAIRIAIISMAMGLVVMVLTVAIMSGFQQEVRNKVIGFGSHIQVTRLSGNTNYETQPIAVSDSLLDALKTTPNVRHMQAYATMPALIKANDLTQGVLLKGVDSDFDWSFLKKNLTAGEVLHITPDSLGTQVVISQSIADKMQLQLGDGFITYLMGDRIKARKFTIAGIYETHFPDYDNLFILTDIQQIQRLNGWGGVEVGALALVSGLEILVDDYEQLDHTTEELLFSLSGQTDAMGNSFYVQSIKQLNPMIFAWLDVLDMNVVVILLLMLLVAGFSMISGLLIIILERANMIGILKAMGENDTNIRRIFLHLSVFLMAKGLFWGNLIALGLCFIQKQFGIFKLDASNYYMSEAPVNLTFSAWLLINLGVLICTLLMLIVPSYLVAKIAPAKSIRFE
ncbi:ABC transporter, permease protein [Candidatus Symbiothrix dinenymphae]|nr:ABC transporter, permease protein [Candidatus Symbiothrix dinenymphae]